MKTPHLAVACLFASLSLVMESSGSEDTTAYAIASRAEIDEFGTANGFCRAQRMSAQALGGVSPAKAAALTLELARFDRETGDGCREVERALKNFLKGLASSNDEFEGAWSTFVGILDRALADQQRTMFPRGFDEAAADSFTAELTARRKGKMDQEILGTILSASHEFRRYPEQELSRGFREIFATSGLPKAGGIRMQLKVPVSWKGNDGDGPHVVQKWTSRIDGSGAAAMLILVAVPVNPPDMAEIDSELAAGLLSEEVREFLPAGSVVEAAHRIQLMFKPALRTTTMLRSQLSEKVFVQRNHLYFAQANGGVVILQCGVGTAGDASALPALLERYTNLCEIVASSMLDLNMDEKASETDDFQIAQACSRCPPGFQPDTFSVPLIAP